MRDFTEYNYACDPRTQGAAKAPILYTEDGEEVKLPTVWEVCHVCNGEGKHVNPSIDCNGLTQDDFDSDPDFAEEYMAGTYDVTCNCCQGRTTVQAVDWDRLTPAQSKAYRKQLDDDALNRAEHLAELRMGA